MTRVLVDTGPLVAMLVRDEQHHEACARAIRELRPPVFTCWPVVSEAAWLLRGYAGGVQRLLDAFNGGLLQLLPLDESAMPSIGAVMHRYQKLKPDLADACLLHLAEREKIYTVFTLDRRDFSIYRLAGKRKLTLLPDL